MLLTIAKYTEKRSRTALLTDEEMKEAKDPSPPPQVAKLKELPPGQLFAINCEDDRAAHERLHELIEDVLAAAPYRSSGRPSRIRGERAREVGQRGLMKAILCTLQTTGQTYNPVLVRLPLSHQSCCTCSGGGGRALGRRKATGGGQDDCRRLRLRPWML